MPCELRFLCVEFIHVVVEPKIAFALAQMVEPERLEIVKFVAQLDVGVVVHDRRDRRNRAEIDIGQEVLFLPRRARQIAAGLLQKDRRLRNRRLRHSRRPVMGEDPDHRSAERRANNHSVHPRSPFMPRHAATAAVPQTLLGLLQGSVRKEAWPAQPSLDGPPVGHG